MANNNKEDMEDISLSGYLKPGISQKELPYLQTAQKCSSLFLLFKELVRSHLNDFWIKLSILIFLAQDKSKTTWTPHELTNDLHWVQEGPRKKIITQLSRSNWLIFHEGNYQLSPFAKSILSMLTTLVHQEEIPDALGANISSLSLLEMYQNDSSNTLRMFINELVRVDKDIQNTLESNSEYLVKKLNKRVRSQFEIAIKSREHLEHLPSKDFHTYRLKQEIHEKLAGFHARLSQVQRAQNDMVARKIVLADKSLSQHDIDSFLISSSAEQLADLGRSAISSPIKVTDLVPQLMIYETEWQMEKERIKESRVGWTQLEMASESEDDPVKHNKFLRLVGEVNHVFERQEHFRIEEFIPHENWETSSFRFSMLSVLESGVIPTSFNVLSEEVCPQLQVEYPEDIKPALPIAELNDQFSGVKEITKGVVSQVKEKEE